MNVNYKRLVSNFYHGMKIIDRGRGKNRVGTKYWSKIGKFSPRSNSKFMKVQLGKPNDWNFAMFAYLPDQLCSKSLHLTTGQNYLGQFFE